MINGKSKVDFDEVLVVLVRNFIDNYYLNNESNTEFKIFFDFLHDTKFDWELKSLSYKIIRKYSKYSEKLSAVKSFFYINQEKLVDFINRTIIEENKIILYYFVISFIAEDNLNIVNYSFPIIADIIVGYRILIEQKLYWCLVSLILFKYLELNDTIPEYIIFNMLTDFEPYNIEIISKILSYEFIKEEVKIYLTELIRSGIVMNHTVFVDCDFTIILNVLYNDFFSFESLSFYLLTEISKIKLDDNIREIIRKLPLSLVQSVNVNYFTVTPMESEVYELDLLFDQRQPLDIYPSNLLSDELCQVDPESIETNITYDSIISESDITLLRKILIFLDVCQPPYKLDFLEAFTKIDSEKCTPLVLYLMTNMKQPSFSELMVDYLIGVFQPCINIYNKCENFNYVNFLRNEVIKLFVAHNPLFLRDIILERQNHVFLVSDVFFRFQSLIPTSVISDVYNEDIISIAVTVLNYLTEINIKLSKSDEVQRARSSLYVFLISILSNSDISKICYQSNTYTIGFLKQLFEPCIQKQFIKVFKDFVHSYGWSQNDNVLLQSVSRFIDSVIEISASLNFVSDLPKDLTYIVIGAAVHEIFIPDVQTIFYKCLQYLKKFPTQAFLKIMLNFLEFFLRRSLVSPDDISSITYITKLVEGECLSKDIFDIYLQLLSANNTFESIRSFVIINGNIILPFLSLFKEENQVIEVYSLFIDLCNNSYDNCLKCHESHLDLLLINILTNFGNPVKFYGYDYDYNISKETAIKYIVPLLFFISSVSSDFILSNQILCSIHPSSSNIFKNELFSELCNVVSYNSGKPIEYLNLGENEKLEVKGLDSTHIKSGFMISFWFFSDTLYNKLKNGKCPIFTITDLNGGFLTAKLADNSIKCILSSENTKYKTIFKDCVPNSKWVYIKLVLLYSDKTLLFMPLENAPCVSFAAGNFSFADGPLQIYFGKKQENDARYSLGNIIFSSYSNSNSVENIDTIFTYPSTENTNIFTFKIFQHNDIHDLTILDCFKLNIEKFIPLFYNIETITEDYLMKLVNLVRCIIISKCKKQIDYPFFDVLSEIFMTYPIHYLTYQLYLEFYNMFIAVYDIDIKICQHIMTCILLNLNIWYCCEDSSVTKIVHHWFSVLFNTHKTLFLESMDIPKLLSILRIYFYFEGDNNNFIIDAQSCTKKRSPQLNVQSCRQCILNILLSILTTGNDVTSHVRLIISHMIETDSKQILDLLNLLINAFKSSNIFISDKSLILTLYTFLDHTNPDIFIKALNVMCILSPVEFISVHTKVLTSPCFFSNNDISSIFPSLVENINDNIYSLYILISSSIHLKKTYDIINALRTIEIDEENTRILVSDTLNIMWLILLIIHNKNFIKVVQKILEKLLINNFNSSFAKEFTSLFDFFIFHGYVFLEDVQRNILLNVGTYFYQNQDHKKFKFLADVLLKFLFLKVQSNSFNDSLHTRLINSPYLINNIVKEVNHISLDTISDIYINSTNTVSFNSYHFCLRISKDGKITENDIFTLLFAIVIEISDSNFYEIWAKILNVYKTHEKKSYAFSQEMFYLIKKYEEQMSSYYIITLDKIKEKIKAIPSSAEICIDNVSKQSKSDLSRLYLEEISKFYQDIKCNTIQNKMLFKCIFEIDPLMFHSKIGSNNCNCIISYNLQKVMVKKHKIMSSFSPKTIFIDKSNNNYECIIVKVGKMINSNLFLYTDHLLLCYSNNKEKIVYYNEIESVVPRNLFHLQTSLQIMMKNENSLFIYFEKNVFDIFLPEFRKKSKAHFCYIPRNFSKEYYSVTKEWLSGSLTNFSYIMSLNIASGRSYYSEALYPIFPWVITDFDCEKLDFYDYKVHRDFQKHVCTCSDLILSTSPSFPSSVYYFLGKIPPFDRIEDHFKLGKITSLSETFKIMNNLQTSFELPPQYFISPDYIDFELPKWCQDKYEFVYLHRKALESDNVTQNLNSWIDLIFGYNQRGKNGTQCPSPVIFEDIWHSKTVLDNPNSIKQDFMQKGHMPTLLFQHPHPKKKVKEIKNTQDSKIFLQKTGIVFAVKTSIKDNEIHYLVQCKDELLNHVVVNFDKLQNSKINSSNTSVRLNSKTTHHPVLSGFVVTNVPNMTLTVVKRGSVKRREFKLANTQFVATDGNTIVFTDGCSEINILDINTLKYRKPLLLTIQQYVSAIAINENNDLLVIGTKNNMVYGKTLGAKHLFNTDVGHVPTMFIITPIYNYIVSISESEVALLDTYGYLIRKVQINFDFKKWCTWFDNGAEYIAFSDSKGRVRCFEAFYLNISDIIVEIKPSVASIDYVNHYKCFSIITSDGYCTIVNHNCA